MKKLLIIPLILLTLTLYAQKKTQKAEPAQTKSSQQVAVQETLKLTNNIDSTQYILGAYLGQYINANNIAITKPDLFLKGLDDALKNKQLLVNADSIPKKMNELLTKVVIERGRILEKQLFDNVKGKPGVGNLPDGVCYLIVKAGTGPRPLVTDSVSIHVKGYLPEGKLFEDTYTKNIPFKTTPGSLIEGLKETLQIMPSGSLWRIFIPSSLAYGEKGIPGLIPAYSAVVFDIELLNIIK